MRPITPDLAVYKAASAKRALPMGKARLIALTCVLIENGFVAKRFPYNIQLNTNIIRIIR
jgi:hypothetical protein